MGLIINGIKIILPTAIVIFVIWFYYSIVGGVFDSTLWGIDPQYHNTPWKLIPYEQREHWYELHHSALGYVKKIGTPTLLISIILHKILK